MHTPAAAILATLGFLTLTLLATRLLLGKARNDPVRDFAEADDPYPATFIKGD